MPIMPEKSKLENKKILPVINNQVIKIRNTDSSYKEINVGCGCGSASCNSCPGALGIKPGSEKSVVFRNVFIYLAIISFVLVATYTAKQILTSILM